MNKRCVWVCNAEPETLRARSEPTVNSPAESEVAAAEQGILGVVVEGCHIVPGGQGRHCQLIASSGSGNVGDRGEAQKCPCSLPQGHLQTLPQVPLTAPLMTPPLYIVSPGAAVSCGRCASGLDHWLRGHLRSDPGFVFI